MYIRKVKCNDLRWKKKKNKQTKKGEKRRGKKKGKRNRKEIIVHTRIHKYFRFILSYAYAYATTVPRCIRQLVRSDPLAFFGPLGINVIM